MEKTILTIQKGFTTCYFDYYLHIQDGELDIHQIRVSKDEKFWYSVFGTDYNFVLVKAMARFIDKTEKAEFNLNLWPEYIV